jgi:hypothetical protein
VSEAPLVPTFGQYRAARYRWDEHQRLREILPDRTYPLMERDRDTCLAYLQAVGEPPEGILARLLWRLQVYRRWRQPRPGGGY